MARPQTLREQIREIPFVPDQRLIVYFATCKYNAVWHRDDKGFIDQFYLDLPDCKQDCKTIRSAMKRYKITDTGENDMYIMDNDPSDMQVKATITNIRKRIRSKPDDNFLIIYVLAGHGM